MGRKPCCSKEGLNRGAWTATEDDMLVSYIAEHGEGKWGSLPKRAGLKRCGKSCRLRWLNYLRPGIKRGNISVDEEDLIVRLHTLLGNRPELHHRRLDKRMPPPDVALFFRMGKRSANIVQCKWSLIAGRLPGRTDNEIKNYWNSTLSKKVLQRNTSSIHHTATGGVAGAVRRQSPEPRASPIRTKAVRCTTARVLAANSQDDGRPPESTPVGDPLEEAAKARQAAEQKQELAGGEDDLAAVHIVLDLDDIELGLGGFLSPWRGGDDDDAGGAGPMPMPIGYELGSGEAGAADLEALLGEFGAEGYDGDQKQQKQEEEEVAALGDEDDYLELAPWL
ncbi:hypothetical protein ABZP36_018683 [Zizania latifolia]